MMFSLHLLFFLTFSGVVKELPGYGTVDEFQFSDFCPVGKKNGHLYYWFIAAEFDANVSSPTTPVLIWLNGGPGASSLFGQFVENGPYQLINSTNIERRVHSWTKLGHMIFIDNPVGSGYSYCDEDGYVTTETELAQQFHECILGIYETIFTKGDKDIRTNPLYITGESYAGKYIPHIGDYIVQQNQLQGTTQINLQSLIIGNGGYDPLTMYKTLPNWYYNLGMVTDKIVHKANILLKKCTKKYNDGDLLKAYDLCNNSSDLLTHEAGDVFLYDIREKNGSALDGLSADLFSYLNSPETQKALYTVGHKWKDSDGTSEPNPVVNALINDVMLNNTLELFEPIMASGVGMMLYVGNMDGSMWGYQPHQAVLKNFFWPGRNDFWNGERIIWKNSAGLVGGYVRSGGNLTYMVVHDSGHLVPTNQPLTALEMVNIYMKNLSWE